MSFQKLLEEDRRLVILRTLAQDAGYDLNEHVLSAALAELGHTVSRDRLRADLAWLAEQGLIKANDISGVRVVRLTPRGEDVALGRAMVPGVKRPAPED